ncbi:MAG TPA: LCP family protein [Acidimicrobiales bacterium]|nr:LCP family protein [Acidimicrobiales bacterium]
MTESSTDTADPAGPVDPDDPSSYGRISMPSTRRGGSRAQLRRQRRRQRRIRYLGVAGAVAVVVGLVAVLVGSGGGGHDGDGSDVPAARPAVAVPPVLVAQRDASGRATSLFVLSPAATKGGTILLIPPGTLTEVVSLGLEPISRSLELGGESRLQATVENLLGVPMGAAVVLDDNGLSGLLGPVGPLTVDVPERVEQVDATGRVEVLYAAGPVTVQPQDASRFLTVKGRSNDLVRLARHQKFLEAWIAAVRARPDTAPTQPPALAKAFDALVAGDVRTRVLPVEAFGTGAAEGELYRVRDAELAEMVTDAFPAAVTTARPRVQILNGTGAVGLAEAVRNRLGAGFDVRLTGNAGTFDHARTEVVYYDRANAAKAKQVRDALGVGTLVFSRNPLDVVDVTIIVGKDFGTA